MAADTDSRVKDVLDDILTLVGGSGSTPGLASRVTYLEANGLTAGQETILRTGVNSNAALTLTTQILRMSYFTARKSFTSTQVRVITGSTAAAATPTVCRLGLYAIDGSDGGSLVASIANDTTLFAAANTAYTRSWSTPYAVVAGQRYALGGLVVTGAAAPTMAGFLFAGGTAATEMNLAPRLTGQITGQADLPASFLAAGISATVLTGFLYGAVVL